MGDESKISELTKELAALKAKTKPPHSLKVLDSWISHTENILDQKYHNRIAWLIATTIVTAKLQQVTESNDSCRFILKGGTLLQHRLKTTTRATKDLDGIVRGDIDDFLELLDDELEIPWGPIDFKRSDIETIGTPAKIIKPRRFTISLLLGGQVWRKVKIEVSPDEGAAGTAQEEFPAPPLNGFGLPTPDRLIGLAMSYQIAQKIHTASDPHDPPEFKNERARDVIDLLLLKDFTEEAGSPTMQEINEAIADIFKSRGAEAGVLGRSVRTWPTAIEPHPHWQADYDAAAKAVGVSLSLGEAVTEVNAWLKVMGKTQ